MISDSPTCTFSALPVKGVNKPTVPPPINGNYTEWTKWSECSATCGGGSQIRTRNCTNPPPQYGGRNCSGIGPANQTLECKPDPCRKFKWTEEFKSISNFCVWNRVQHLPLIVFFIVQSYSAINGKYTDWSKWTTCSATCEGGNQTRTRICSPPKYGGKDCEALGPANQTQECNTDPCRE